MKKWAELMEENREKITDCMIKAFKEAEGCMSGWHVGVEMDELGNVWTTGVLYQGSQSKSSWIGKTTIIDWIAAWNLDYEEENIFENKDYAYLKQEFKNYKIDNDDEYAILRSWMLENHSDILDIWDQAVRDMTIDGFYDEIDDKLNEIIRNQKEYDSYNENNL